MTNEGYTITMVLFAINIFNKVSVQKFCYA
jgi:hypothetical protein